MENENLDYDLKKALSTASETTGDKLIPEVVSEGIRRFVVTRSVLYDALPKRPWPTNSYIHRDVTGLPSAAFKADGGELPAASRGTYAKPTVPMKYIYTRGEVTGPMIEASRSLVDAFALEVELHSAALIRTIEQTLITGDSEDEGHEDEFDGFLKQITIEHDAEGDPLVLNMLDTALDLPDSYPTHLIMDRAMGRRLWSLLQAQQRFTNDTMIGAGFRVPTYNDLPIIRMDNSITGLDDAIIMPDMNWVVFPILQDLTFEPLAKTKDSEDFMIKAYVTLAVEGASLYHCKITDVASSVN